MTWSDLLAEASESRTVPLLVGALIIVPLLRYQTPAEKRRRGILISVVLHLALLPASAALRGVGGTAYRDAHLVVSLFAIVGFVLMISGLVFMIVLPRAHMKVPRIVQDVATAGALAIAALSMASAAGLELTSLIATSAVATAVIGFALQDTLGNVFAGLALQVDDSIRIGDWIQVGSHGGRVTEMRWRYTAIETRNWETLFIPNSALTKAEVLVLGRRVNEPQLWRRWVYFNVDFRYQPSDVNAAVADALQSAPIEAVATEPAPHCILMGFEQSYCRYAVRYWLSDIARDDPTDSAVRTRIYFALKRQGIPLSIPAAALFMTKETSRRRAQKTEADAKKRREVIDAITLFSAIPPDDREELARSLRYAPFTRGEAMTREGAEAHWLYIIIEGEASIQVTAKSGKQVEVGRAGPGSFFGEMSLMTGEPRAATAIALTDVECYRLDRVAFKEVIARRPELVEHLAHLLAARRLEIAAKKEDTGGDMNLRLQDAKSDLVAKMKRFFGL